MTDTPSGYLAREGMNVAAPEAEAGSSRCRATRVGTGSLQGAGTSFKAELCCARKLTAQDLGLFSLSG